MKSRVETNTKLVISVLIISCLVISPNRDLMYVTWPVDNKTVHQFDWAATLGARGFSCAVSGFASLKKWPARTALVFGLRPTKRSSPSHARKHLWYPGYWAPGNSKTVCSVCGERSWSRILASFLKKIPFLIKIFLVFPNPAPYPRSRKSLPEFQWSVFLATTVKLCSI